MEILKESIGIDMSKDKFDVIFKTLTTKGIKIKGKRKFENTYSGFTSFLEWCEKREKTDQTVYVMEATGVYHENLSFFLYEAGKNVVIELPQRIKYYSKSKGIKTKNDIVDSGVIADYGLERSLETWEPPSDNFRVLKDLSREHTAITKMKSMVKNRLHAASYARKKDEKTIERLKSQIELFEEQLVEIKKQIEKTVKEDKKLADKIKKIEKIKGVKTLTIVKVLSETGGFHLFKNINQLVSYAGLDVSENQSGKHQGKTKISKKGNANLRTSLYMPALSARNHDLKMKAYSERIMKTHQYPKQAIVAIMRKLLILIYTLWKKDEEYNPNYQWNIANR